MGSILPNNAIAVSTGHPALTEAEIGNGFSGHDFRGQILNKVIGDLLLALDRPGGRSLLVSCISAYATLKWSSHHHQIYYDDRAWVMKDDSGVLVYPRPKLFGGVEHALASIDRSTFAHYTPEPGHSLVIVGAGIGLEILRASRLVGPQGKVIAIEAHPNTYRCLQRTCDLNGLDNVRLINAAVTREQGEICISDDFDFKSNHLLTGDQSSRGISVQCDSLGNLLNGFDTETIDFLGMNIEGAEVGAFEGMRGLLPRVRRICAACHDFLADQDLGDHFRTQQWVLNYLRQNGFESWSDQNAEHPWLRNNVYGQRD